MAESGRLEVVEEDGMFYSRSTFENDAIITPLIYLNCPYVDLHVICAWPVDLQTPVGPFFSH